MNHLVAVIGIVFVGLSPIWVALAGVSPATATLFRSVYALLPLSVIWFLGRADDTRSWKARLLAIACGLLLALDLTVWHQSIAYIGAGLSTILAMTQVVFVALLAWLVHRERPTSTAFKMIPVILAGAACISGLGQADSYGAAPIPGTILALTSGLLYALFILLFRASARARTPPSGPLLDATIGATVAILIFGRFDPGFSFEISWPAHGYLLALALGSQVAGWLLITYVLPRLAALETSVLMLLQPMVSLIVGVLVLGERVSWLQGAGIVLVIGGVTLVSIRGATRPEKRDETWIADSSPRVSSSGA